MSTKPTILYVDDEIINLQLFEINFSEKYEVFTAINGFKGLEILDEQESIKVIVSDMKMPNMNGVQFIRQAKEKFPDKKYYILTGFEITDEIQEALNTDLIIKYFRKPFEMSEIEEAINMALNP